MPVKQIHVFANSVKFRGFCIAGRELLNKNGKLTYGDWVRPVSDGEDGKLTRSDCESRKGKLPQVLDVVTIQLMKHVPSKHQPENWLINDGYYWVIAKNPGKVPALPIDEPRTLWCAANEPNDRIPPPALARIKDNRSLSLVEVTNFRMHFGWKTYRGETKKRRRALFSYNGRDYDLALTDPVMDNDYARPYPKPEEGTRIVRLDSGRECTLCISLTGPLNGYHYKVVATVIER